MSLPRASRRGSSSRWPKAILDLKREGMSLLVSEQNLHFAQMIADEAVILERGAVRYKGSFAELEARPDVRDAYLAV